MSEYTELNRRFEKKYLPKVGKALKSKVSSLISKIESSGIDAAVRSLRVDLSNPALRKVLGQLYKEIGLRHARIAERRLRKEVSRKSFLISFEVKRFGLNQVWIDRMKQLLENFLNQMSFTINETTREALLKVIQNGIEKGLSVSDIVNNLKELPFTRYQAARIVRTEINRAANVGIEAQGDSFEYELLKTWNSVNDVRTRGRDPEDHADHLRMDGQAVDFYDVFRDPRNGHELRFPGDPKAEAGDTVFCRCVMGTKPKRDQNGRLIPKKSRITVIRPNEIRRPRTITI